MNELEQKAYDMFQDMLRQRQDALNELVEYMESQGKFGHEYVIVDNWQQIISGLENNKLIPYEYNFIPKLALQTLLTTGE